MDSRLQAYRHSVAYLHRHIRVYSHSRSLCLSCDSLLIATEARGHIQGIWPWGNASSANETLTTTLTVSHRPRRGCTRENNHNRRKEESLLAPEAFARGRQTAPVTAIELVVPLSDIGESRRGQRPLWRLLLSIEGQLLSFRQPSDPDSHSYWHEFLACDSIGLYWAENRPEIKIARVWKGLT